MPHPLVTILLPIYNGARYLPETLASVFAQSYTDFEFLIVDDGSTDSSAAIVAACGHPAVRLERLPVNRGIVAALNHGLALARGELIARLDSDDICLPHRLARQVEFMQRRPDVGVCGSWVVTFAPGQAELWRNPVDSATIKARLLFECVFVHPSTMLRRSMLQRADLRYEANYPHSEDYKLWTHCAPLCEFANIPEILLRYRRHSASVGQRFTQEQAASADQIRHEQLRAFGLLPTADELALHNALGRWHVPPKEVFVTRAELWLRRLLNHNQQYTHYEHAAFAHVLAERWYFICSSTASIGLRNWYRYWRSPLRHAMEDKKHRQALRLLVKCVLHSTRMKRQG